MDTGTEASARRRPGHPSKAVNRVVLGILHSPVHGLLDPGICELRYRGRRTSRTVALPVIYARHGEQFVVLVGDARDKVWWRNFEQPYPVEVRRGRVRRKGTGRVVGPQDPAFDPAWHAYRQRQHLERRPGDRLVLIDLAGNPD